jgi:hypothetical protein
VTFSRSVTVKRPFGVGFSFRPIATPSLRTVRPLCRTDRVRFDRSACSDQLTQSTVALSRGIQAISPFFSSDAWIPSHSPRWVTTPSTRADPHSVFGVILRRFSPPGSR